MQNEALEVASLAGHVLLENGAEISRVEETMERIARYYGAASSDFFVLSNGIFTTSSTGYAKAAFIPFKGAQLERVAAVSQISRDIEAGKYTVEQAKDALQKVRQMKVKPYLEQLVGTAVGSAGFCVIFGGGLMDAAAAMVAGMLVWAFVLCVSAPYLSKTLGNIAASLFGTLLCVLFNKIGFGDSLGNMIVGTLIPLIPGVAFTNGIRDIANEDYIAGATRLMDALMVFFCIASGVVISFLLYESVTGNMPVVNGTEPNALTGGLLPQAIAGFLGTLGFAPQFGVPRRNYLQAAVVGAVGWTAYMGAMLYTSMGVAASTFLATVVVALLSRLFAVWFKTPETVFLILGLFPMVPGGAIFWTTFFAVSNRLPVALERGVAALAVTCAIVLGVIIVSALPKSIFHIHGIKDAFSRRR